MRRFSYFWVILLLGWTAAAAPKPKLPALPDFAGWHKSAAAVSGQPTWGLPAAEAAVMREYGLLGIERATYTRGDRRIQAQGWRFRDASGAFGAFTYYRPDNYPVFDIGQANEQAVAGDGHVLFTRGAWLLRVDMDQVTAMTASEMRELAADLATPGGNQWPSLPYYLPRANFINGSLRYVEGPAGLAAAVNWAPAAAMGFQMGAEAVVGSYDFSATNQANQAADAPPAQLVVVAYPTPQIARGYFAALRQQLPQAIGMRRSGPIVILEHGAGAAADPLLQAVNYDADVTMSQPKPVGLEGLPSLIIGIFALCFLIICVAVAVGLMTGGTRALLRRYGPRRFQKEDEETMIRLHLG